MKIRQKIILSGVFNVGLIALIGVSAFQPLDPVLLIAMALLAALVNYLVSRKILSSLGKIEALAGSIAAGGFHKTGEAVPDDELGSVMKAVNSMSDELRQRQDELLQSKKLASMGVLTAGVAHEITNPVNNISMIAQTYAEAYDSMGRADRMEFMHKVEREADRIRDIVKNLLDFLKPREADLSESDVNSVVRKTMDIVGNMLDVSGIEVRLDLKDRLPQVMMDENQIQQVLVNLIVNAIQAMPEGGWLNIGTRFDKGRRVIEICVADTGHGIPPEHIPHVFDPFFSTKGVGGAGLGLSVSYGIIKNHKGNIRVESGVGVGAAFIVELPAFLTRKY